MCAKCGELHNEFLKQENALTEVHYAISDLYKQIQYGSSSAWEYSEPLIVGGPGAPKTYALRSPFQNQVGQEWKVLIANAGAGTALFLISTGRTSIIPGMLSTDTGTIANSNFNGILFTCEANNSIPPSMEWCVLPDSNGTLHCTVNSSQAAYATIQFRRKR